MTTGFYDECPLCQSADYFSVEKFDDPDREYKYHCSKCEISWGGKTVERCSQCLDVIMYCSCYMDYIDEENK